MTTTHSDILIKSSVIESLLAQTATVIDDLQVTAGSVVRGFFDFFRHEAKGEKIECIDFSTYDTIEKLEQIKILLEQEKTACHHKYKRLHYNYTISRIDDRIHELHHHDGKVLDNTQRLFYAIQPGDIMLISYHSKATNLNSMLNTFANNALRLFSKSIFAHIGIIGHGNATDRFEWIHSTLHNDDGRTGVKKLPLKAYLDTIIPCELLVMRCSDTTKQKQEEIVNTGLHHEEMKTKYDTRDAIGDLTGLNIFRQKDAFNCGELVYHCLKTIDPALEIARHAIPGSYIEIQSMEQVYLTRLT